MALLTTQQATATGTTPTYTAVSASDTVYPDGRIFLIVRNAGGSIDTVTVVIPGNGPGGVALADLTVTVPATTGEKWISLVDPAYTDGSTGFITVLHSFTTSVTCAVVRA